MMHYWWYHKSIGLENWTMIIIFSYCFKNWLIHQTYGALLFCYCYYLSAIALKENLTNHVKRQTERKYTYCYCSHLFKNCDLHLWCFKFTEKKVSFSNNASETSYVSFQSISHQKSFKKSTIDFWYFWYENHIRISFRFRCTFVLTNLDNHCLK